MLGAVGAYDWNGTVVMHMAGGTIIPGKSEFFDAKTEAGYQRLAGYMGELAHDAQSTESKPSRCV